jgi:hypothetical protein
MTKKFSKKSDPYLCFLFEKYGRNIFIVAACYLLYQSFLTFFDIYYS